MIVSTKKNNRVPFWEGMNFVGKGGENQRLFKGEVKTYEKLKTVLIWRVALAMTDKLCKCTKPSRPSRPLWADKGLFKSWKVWSHFKITCSEKEWKKESGGMREWEEGGGGNILILSNVSASIEFFIIVSNIYSKY